MTIDFKLLQDPSRWTLHILPLPKRQQTASTSGLTNNGAVGETYGSGYRGTPVYWHGQEPVPLTVEGQKRVGVRHSSGNSIAGFWRKSDGENGGAVGWLIQPDGSLETRHLHDKNLFEWTSAIGANNGSFCGYGLPKAKKGVRVAEQALYWSPTGELIALPVPDSDNILKKEAIAQGTDGTLVVGRIGRTGGQQAVIWKPGEPDIIFLDPESISEAYAVCDGEQVGLRWNGRGSRAALWKGSADSLVDLTPDKHESAVALDCCQGVQAGWVMRKNETRNGAASMASRAALWTGSAKSHLDLQAFVPEPWNASTAGAIDISGGTLRVAGQVTQYHVSDELTSRESHSKAGQRAAIWEAKLG